MRSEAAAEVLLSLVVAPEIAESMVGDLAEAAPAPGKLLFWWSVLRTAAFRIGRDLCDAPLRMLQLAFCGTFYSLLLSGVVALAFSLLSNAAMAFGGGVRTYRADGGLSMVAPPGWVMGIAIIALVTVVPFLVGWLLANRSRGCEMTALLAYFLLAAALHGLKLYLSALQLRRIGHPWRGTEETLAQLWSVRGFLTMGAIFSRIGRFGPSGIRKVLKSIGAV